MTWRTIRHLPSTAKQLSLPVSSTGARSSDPSGPRPAVHGRGQGRVPSQLPSWQTRSSHNPIVMSITDPTDPWLNKMSNCWPLEEQHYAEVFAVSALLKTGDRLLRSILLTPNARAPFSKSPTGSTGPAPSSGTLTHMHQATSAPVAQNRDPTLRNGPVVTPRP